MALLCFAAVVYAVSVNARDAWVVNGLAVVPAPECKFFRWVADAVLHNLSADNAEVRLLDASNGAFIRSGSAIVRAHSSARVFELTDLSFSPQALYVLHLDVPDSIAVEDRLNLHRDSCALGDPPTPVPFAHFRLPVIRRLAPPSEHQYHLGADLGGQSVRLNVAIYNAAATPANVEVTVIGPFCTDSVLGSQRTVVGANEIAQITIVAPTQCHGAAVSKIVDVISDQPGFSFVSVLSNDALPSVTAAVASGE